MRDAAGNEVKLGSKIAVSVGRRGYLRFGTVTAIKERVYHSYYGRNKDKDVVSSIVTYSADSPANQYERGGYVKKTGKFVVIG